MSNNFTFRWFTKDFSKYKFVIFEIIVVSLFLRMLTVIVPFSFQTLIDKVIPYSRYYSLFFMLGILIIVALVQAYFSFVDFLAKQYLSIRLAHKFASKFYHHVFYLPSIWQSNWRRGDILARLQEIGSIQNFINTVLFGITLDFIFVAFYLVLLFILNVKLTLIFLSVIPLQLILFLASGALLRRRIQTAFVTDANVNSLVIENLSSLETIKSLNLEDQTLERFDIPFSDSLEAGFRVSFLQQFLDLMLHLIVTTREALIIICGAYFVFKGSLTLGTLIAFYLLALQIVAPLENLSSVWEQIQHVRISKQRLGDVMREEPEDLSNGKLPQPTSDVVLEAKNIAFCWEEENIFQNISFKVNKGDFIGIFGPSGTGKTTLAKVIAGLIEPSEGKILYHGHDVKRLSIAAYRREVTYIPSRSDIFSDTLEYNLNPKQYSYEPKDFEKAIIQADAEFLLRLPNGLKTKIGEASEATFSTGQKQRISIARALLLKSKLLIFDEPTASIDETSAHHIMQTLKSLVEQGRNVLVISHDTSMQKYFTQILHIGEEE
ncbi:MAG: peptidase domain-containing ABC transporter [Alphaproteobacteria bacterium]